jgi:hypothetical protein
MNLPDAPVAHEGFFAAHFTHSEGSGQIEGLLRPNSWRKLIKPENACYIKLENT